MLLLRCPRDRLDSADMLTKLAIQHLVWEKMARCPTFEEFVAEGDAIGDRVAGCAGVDLALTDESRHRRPGYGPKAGN